MSVTRVPRLAIGLVLVSLLGTASGAVGQRPGRAPVTTPPGRGLAAGPGSAPACVVDPSQMGGPPKTPSSLVSADLRAPPPTPRPTRTKAARSPDASLSVRPAPLGADLSGQLCESLNTGRITTDEVTAMLGTMEKEHGRKSHTKRKRIANALGSYTYEYTLDVGGMKFYQKPGVGYCSDFDWRFKVRNISQQAFTVFSTTGEVGACVSPGFGLFFIPGLEAVMPYPVPGLCLDDGAITKLDLRNVNNEFEGTLVELVNLVFEKLRKYDAKLCIVGSPTPPWFMPVIVPKGQMVVYCTSTRDCEIDAAKLVAAAQKNAKKE